ncbi:MAG: universal stress protein [Deltaproteobacteria bacterium]|nr:universal stress protein [Deltaproteobacteria bacterium]
MHIFSKILVPLDLSSRGESAIRMALDLADPDRGVVCLLHVIETLEGIDDDELEAFYSELEAKARAAMGAWIDELGSGGAKMEPLICYGHRAREILRQADELGCDLIVLSSHRIDPDHPAGGIGTISHQVALVCDGPVLLIR